MKKLKGLFSANGIKSLFVDHGEKIGLGVIALAVLVILSGSRFLPVPGTPQDILTKVEEGKRKIDANNWSPEKGAEYALVDFVQEVDKLRQPPPAQAYEFSTAVFSPLYRKQEQAREPDLLPVLDLIAQADMVILGKSTMPSMDMVGADGMNPDGSMPGESMLGASGLPGQNGQMTEDDLYDRFAPRTNTGSGPGAGFPGAPGLPGGPGMLGPGGGHGGGGGAGVPSGGAPGTPGATRPGRPGSGRGRGSDRRSPEAPDAAHGGGGGLGGMPGMAGMPGMSGMPGMGGMMGMGSGMEPDGKLVVSVRGVWPIKDQLQKIQRALNLDSLNAATQFLQIIDLRLERQMAIAGPDPWAGEWQAVDIEVSKEVLKQAVDYEMDPVPASIQDATITSPLPMRLQGRWGELATHPRIRNFQLSDEEIKKEEAFQKRIREQYEKMVELQGGARPVAKGFATGGFSSQSNDFRSMASGLMSYGNQEMFTEMGMPGMGMPGMGGAGMPGIGGAGAPGMRPGMQGGPRGGALKPEDVKAQLLRVTAAGTYVLFRYFDFDVRPGMAYRYRVKLDILNPNLNRPVEELVAPSVALGDTRETPVSNISNPAVVPNTVNYFVKEIRRDPAREAVTSGRPGRAVAVMQMFEKDSEFGTINSDQINLSSPGQFIGETKDSLRLDVSKPVYKTEKVTFSSGDVFVDASGDMELAAANHPDLKIPPANRGQAGLPGELLVVTEGGELKMLDPMTRFDRQRSLEEFVKGQRGPYEDIKDKEDAPAGGLDGAYPGMNPEDMMMGMPGAPEMGGRKPGRKPKR